MARLKYYNTKTNSWENISVNGEDGYTPIKGVDYFDGKDGKSAYAYAKEAGYTGTEEEFAQKLVQEPLIGTTDEITPSHVAEAIEVGREVSITYNDATYGAVVFSSFVRADGFNGVFTSEILLYGNTYNLVELYGNTERNNWTLLSTQLAQYNDIPAPVVGTTAEITPSQVKALMDEGKPFAITHTDSIYGSMLFNSFVYSQAVNNSILSTTVFQTGGMTFCAQLIGSLNTDKWSFSAFTLATTEDIPTIPESLKNPYPLTINGTKYDGSEAKTISGLATENYVNNKVASMVDSAPETLNTLNELAAALGDDPNFATTIANQIGNKVDKVSGKGLSTNDYTDAEKSKLAGIAKGANKTIVDVYLDGTSANPVENRVVKAALDQKPGERNPNNNSAETFNYAFNHARGDYSHAEGWNTEAYGISAHAEGTESCAIGDYSHAEGRGITYVTNHDIHISGEANTKQYQIIDQEINSKLKVYSIIEYNNVYAQVRKIENNIITLSETLSSEPLENATAYIVTNYGAIGKYSHAEGYETLANGESSHAEGTATLALGNYSHAEGAGTIAVGGYQHVQGRNNIEDSEKKYAHIIGNGATGNSRSNAHTIDWQGNAWYAGDIYIHSTSGTNKDEGSKKLATVDQVNNKVDKVSGKGLSTNDYTNTDRAKLDNTNIAYGTCSTAAATAEKVVVLNSNLQWSLKTGSIIMVKFDVSNTAENVKINVNNTGAYPIWYNNAEYTGTGTAYTGYANRTITYMFNGTHYVWITSSYDANSTYTNAALGQGYATCSTAAATTAKVGTLSSYKLVTGGIVAVKFTNSVPANATLNINSTGAKSIYYKGAKITGDIIKAGEVATFVYSTYYHLISIDRCDQKALTINGVAYDGSAQKTIETEIFYVNYNKTNNSFDKTLEQIEAAYQAKRQIVCVYPRFEPYVSFVPLSLRGSAYEWEFSGWIDNENYISIQNKDGQITIFENTLSSKIEQIVDQKIASIPNAEEVTF